MNTTTSPQGSLAASMLVLGGPVVTLVASFVASDGEPVRLIHEAGMLALAASAASFLVTLTIAGVLFAASRGASRWAALAAPLMLVPAVIMALAELLGAGLVADAVRHADPVSQLTMLGRGSAEVMAARALGAALTLGGALALSVALLPLALARPTVDAGAPVPGSGLAALVLLGVVAVALLVLVDAALLRRGLSAASSADAEARDALLALTVSEARTTYVALLVAVALTTFLGGGVAVVALQRGAAGGARMVAATWLVGALFGGGDIATVHYVTGTLAIPVAWEREADFVPLALDARGRPAAAPVCLATLTRVRCPAGDAPYETLDRVLPRAPAVGPPSEGGFSAATLAGEPPLSVALDARLPAPALRQLLQAGARAGYRSLEVVGTFVPPAFRGGDVPPLLRTQARATRHASWLLTVAVSDGGDGLAPIAIDVRDDDTAQTVLQRTSQVTDQSVLVLPAPLPAAAPPAPPTEDLAAQLGAAAGEAPDPTGQPLDAPAISRVIRSHLSVVRACYERGLRFDPELAGRVTVRFTITPSGAVSDVTASPTLDAPPVLRCIEAAVARLSFPADASREPITINYPFVFNASP